MIIITDVFKERAAIDSLKYGVTDFVRNKHVTHQLVPAIERALLVSKIRAKQKDLVGKLVDLENKISAEDYNYQVEDEKSKLDPLVLAGLISIPLIAIGGAGIFAGFTHRKNKRKNRIQVESHKIMK